MAIDISAEVTRNWPQTEGKLAAASELDYAAEKVRAIARAKRDAYGRQTVPTDEGDVHEIIAYWVADKATVYLIPLAIEYYSIKEHISTAKEGATLTHYDKITALQKLKAELEAACARAWDEVLALAQPTTGDTDRVGRQTLNTPTVRVDGLIVDPFSRAINRGSW